MAHGFKHGGSGGGSGGFGLQIVEGLVRPKNPTQGMIWAKTEHKVTYYYLSATKPENPAEGTLWMRIGDSGDKNIVSPVSKEWITVYTLSAEQYISGEWISIEVMSYQDGAWVEWITYLYKKGDECADITGGWQARAWVISGYTAKAPTVTKTSDGVKLSFSSNALSGVYEVKNDIDLSKYKTIRFDITFAAGWWMVGAINRSSSVASSYIASTSKDANQGTERKIVDVDISNVNGSYDISVLVTSASGTADFTLHNVWME